MEWLEIKTKDKRGTRLKEDKIKKNTIKALDKCHARENCEGILIPKDSQYVFEFIAKIISEYKPKKCPKCGG
jgi:hypothetical protein